MVSRLAFLLLIVGCDSGSPAPAVDAAHTADGSASPIVCTGELYDLCDPNAATNTCKNGAICKQFGTGGGGGGGGGSTGNFAVCTSNTCSASSPCAMQAGAAVTCNNMGICKPPAPNADCNTAP